MEERKKIEIDIKLESSDVLKFILRMFYGRSTFMLVASILTFCFVFPLLSLLVIIRVLSGEAHTISGFAYLPLFGLAIFIFLIVFVIISSKKNAKQTHLIFMDEEINVVAPNVTSQISWTNYRKIQETKTDFLLFSTNPNGSFPIPKHFFESEDQIQEFRELVRDKLGDKAELKND